MCYKKPLVWLLFISIVIGFLFLPNYTCSDLDSFDYLDVAKNIVKGNGITHSSLYIDMKGNAQKMPLITWFPLFPLFISFFIRLGFESILAAKFVNIIFSALTLIPLYFLTKRLFNKEISYVTCLATVFFYPLVWNKIYVLSETVYTFFLVSALYSLTRKGPKWLLFSGVLAALSYLTRGPGILLLISILIFVLFFRGKKLIEKIKLLCYSIFSFSIVALPWWIRNYLTMENPFYYSQATLFSLNFNYIVGQFVIFPQIFIDLLPLSIFIPIAFYYLGKNRKKLSLLLIYPVLHTALFLIARIDMEVYGTREISPIYLPFLILGVRGLYDFYSFLNKKLNLTFGPMVNSKYLIIIPVFVAFLFLNLSDIYGMYLETWNVKPYISEIVNSNVLAFLKNNTNKGDVIMMPASTRLGIPDVVRFYIDRIVINRPTYSYYSKVEIPLIKFSAIRFKEYDFNSDGFINGLKKLNVGYIVIFKSDGIEEGIEEGIMDSKFLRLNKEENVNFLLNLLNNKEDEILNFLELVYNSDDGIVYKVNTSKIS